MTERKKSHPLSVLHIIGMLVILSWWSWYFWQHSPTRQLLHAQGAAHHAHQAAPGSLQRGAGAALSAATAQVGDALRMALADVAGGLVVLFLFSFATGVYVRRFEIWLQARSSGAAMGLAGTGLSDKALAANADRGGAPR
jgi:hypothetical protein